MKNKKVLIGIVLFIVVLALGIGYAAITDNLTITGTATTATDNKNFTVVFTGEKTPDTTTGGVTATVTANSTTATLDVTGLATKGDTKTATFKIKNTSKELKALVDVQTETITNTEFFTVDATVDNPTTALAPDGETTVTVTVTLNKTPIEVVSGTINITLLATAVLGS